MKASKLGLSISEGNWELAATAARHMITVYNDTMRGNSSAHSWPSRAVASVSSESINLASDFKACEPKSCELSYVNPTNHSQFLDYIVRADAQNICDLLTSAIAVSLRVDESVDKQQVDNVFMMAKIVSGDGSDRLVFLGFAEPDECKAIDMMSLFEGASIDWLTVHHGRSCYMSKPFFDCFSQYCCRIIID